MRLNIGAIFLFFHKNTTINTNLGIDQMVVDTISYSDFIADTENPDTKIEDNQEAKKYIQR